MQLSKTNYCRIFAFLAVMLVFGSLSAHADYSLSIKTYDGKEMVQTKEKFTQISDGVYELKLDYLMENQSFIVVNGSDSYGIGNSRYNYEPVTLSGIMPLEAPYSLTNVLITLKDDSPYKTLSVTGEKAALIFGDWYDQSENNLKFVFNDTPYDAKLLKIDGNGDYSGFINLNYDEKKVGTIYLILHNSIFIPIENDNNFNYIDMENEESKSYKVISVDYSRIGGWRTYEMRGPYYVKLKLEDDPEYYGETGWFTISEKPFEIEKQEVSFVWRVDEEEITDGGSHDKPAIEFNYGDGRMLTLGVENMESKDALNEDLFQVRYREPGYLKSTTPAEINKRLATDNSNPDEEGYKPATENEYTLLPTNSTINFKAAGDYKITASIPSSQNYTITPSTLYLRVNQVTLNLGSGQSQPFNANESLDEGANIFEGLIEFTSNLEYNKDFTVDVLPPADNDWTSTSVTDVTDLEAQYAAVFNGSSGSLYTQLAQIGFDKRVDGFYNASELKVSVKESDTETEGNSAFNVAVTVPCSGVYTVTVSPTATNAFKESTTVISVYPNLYATFNQDTGFNINGYMWVKNEENEYVITLPEDTDLEKCVGFIPGTYFASSLTTNATAEEFSDGTKDMVYRTGTMNLTEKTNGSTQLTVNVRKNGAESTDPFIFFVTTGDENNNPSTGIDFIGIDSEEPVYFNLQGLRVENPERGIFIKISNGKASKVVL